MKNKRIAIQLPMPSISLKNFLERLLKDEDFFVLALENPSGAAKECGVNLDLKTLEHSDFSIFFGAVAGLKEVLKKAGQKTLDFESIFGKPAEIRGSMIEAERHQGFMKEWDNRGAFTEKEICQSVNRYFFRDRGGRLGQRLAELLKDQSRLTERNKAVFIENLAEVRIDQYINKVRLSDIQRDLISRTMESSETNNHTVTEWNTDRFMQSNTRSERGVDKNFEADGMSAVFEELMQGPLINPVDLASVSARLETFTQMLQNQISDVQ